MIPSAALEALNMLEPLFFLHLLELLNVWATICKMSRFMTPVAHGVRQLQLLLLLHLLCHFSFALCHLLLESKATLVTEVSLSLHQMLKGDF